MAETNINDDTKQNGGLSICVTPKKSKTTDERFNENLESSFQRNSL